MMNRRAGMWVGLAIVFVFFSVVLIAAKPDAKKTTATNNVSTSVTKPNTPVNQVASTKPVTKSPAFSKGIYITQWNLENTSFIQYLIRHAKASGIDTFVVDMELPGKRYKTNIDLVKQAGIRWVARVIMFPGGGTAEMISNPQIWQKKYALVKQAVEWGADEIQLDYIRFSSKQAASPENAKKVENIIAWYKNQLKPANIPLQVDIFGITSFGESKHIGQNVETFAKIVDALCPMVYPSHYVPFPTHFKQPYQTVFGSLTRIKKILGEVAPVKIYAYIELSNYHYPMTKPKTLEYIKAQLNAVQDANVHGWYAWSPHNRYDNLFTILEGKVVSIKNEPDVKDPYAEVEAKAKKK